MSRKDWEKTRFNFDDSENLPDFRIDRFPKPDRFPKIDPESIEEKIDFDSLRRKLKYDDVLRKVNLDTEQKGDLDIEAIKRRYKLDKPGKFDPDIERIANIVDIYSPNSLSSSTDHLRSRLSHLKKERADLERLNRISSIDREVSEIESQIKHQERIKDPEPNNWGWIFGIGFLLLMGLAAL